jgi:hypothetical protein
LSAPARRFMRNDDQPLAVRSRGLGGGPYAPGRISRIVADCARGTLLPMLRLLRRHPVRDAVALESRHEPPATHAQACQNTADAEKDEAERGKDNRAGPVAASGQAILVREVGSIVYREWRPLACGFPLLNRDFALAAYREALRGRERVLEYVLCALAVPGRCVADVPARDPCVICAGPTPVTVASAGVPSRASRATARTCRSPITNTPSRVSRSPSSCSRIPKWTPSIRKGRPIASQMPPNQSMNVLPLSPAAINFPLKSRCRIFLRESDRSVYSGPRLMTSVEAAIDPLQWSTARGRAIAHRRRAPHRAGLRSFPIPLDRVR